jgi:hypothetical protein
MIMSSWKVRNGVVSGKADVSGFRAFTELFCDRRDQARMNVRNIGRRPSRSALAS